MEQSSYKGQDSREMERLRREIDDLDVILLETLNRRAACSLEIGKIKARSCQPVLQAERERRVMDTLAGRNRGPLPEDHLRAIYAIIMLSSRTLQTEQQGSACTESPCTTQ